MGEKFIRGQYVQNARGQASLVGRRRYEGRLFTLKGLFSNCRSLTSCSDITSSYKTQMSDAAATSSHNDLQSLCNTQCVGWNGYVPPTPGEGSRKTRFTPHTSLKKQAAFTLAEVLITLGIIGVVAAMTMPSLIQKQKEKEYAAKLKKFNSMMSQAVIMAINEEGPIENWGLTKYDSDAGMSDEEIAESEASREKFFEILSKYLKVVEYCPYSSTCEEWERHSLDGTAFSSFPKRMVLADGTMINGVTILSPQCNKNVGTSTALQNVCGEFFVDVNGKKGPNATGKDVFMFYYTKYGVTPVGTKEETNATFDLRPDVTEKLQIG